MKPPDPRFDPWGAPVRPWLPDYLYREPELPTKPERTNVPNRAGLPAPKPYEWRVKERQREQEVEQELAEIRALLRP
jgi:hypothetical protein